MQLVDVLIVGAGPSGLMMASELALYGVGVEIIDECQGPTNLSKALAIQARTLEILDQVADVTQFFDEGLPLKNVCLMSGSEELAQVSFDDIESPFPLVLSIEQSKTEKILIKHAESLGVKIQRKTKLLKFKDEGGFVTAVVKNLDHEDERTINARYVIGCDGAHSTIRKQLNMPFEGELFSEIFSLADVSVEWPYPHEKMRIFLGEDQVMAAIPMKGEHRYRLVFQLKRCQDVFKTLLQEAPSLIGPEKIPPPSIQEVQEILDLHTSGMAKAQNPVWMSNFHINSRLAAHYRKNHLFLVGDAAHIHSPVGGQGMNTGIQDAFNLAWKLAYVLRDKAPVCLLDSYETERHAIGKTLLDATERASKIVSLKNYLLIKLRNKVISFLARKTNLPKEIANRISQTKIYYQKSKIITVKGSVEATPKTGSRAPNISLNIDGKEMSLQRLRKNPKNYAILIFFRDYVFEKIKNEIQEIEKKTAHAEINVILISNTAFSFERNSPWTSKAVDPSGTAFKAYGIQDRGVYVIRPDGYICLKSSEIDEKFISDFLKKQIYV
jgi:2-polyprenyl-6-methoxyphenol hydroxylase-like FAD-dependent oxidoreductase